MRSPIQAGRFDVLVDEGGQDAPGRRLSLSDSTSTPRDSGKNLLTSWRGPANGDRHRGGLGHECDRRGADQRPLSTRCRSGLKRFRCRPGPQANGMIVHDGLDVTRPRTSARLSAANPRRSALWRPRQDVTAGDRLGRARARHRGRRSTSAAPRVRTDASSGAHPDRAHHQRPRSGRGGHAGRLPRRVAACLACTIRPVDRSWDGS